MLAAPQFAAEAIFLQPACRHDTAVYVHENQHEGIYGVDAGLLAAQMPRLCNFQRQHETLLQTADIRPWDCEGCTPRPRRNKDWCLQHDDGWSVPDSFPSV